MLKRLGRGDVDIVIGTRFAGSQPAAPAPKRLALRTAARLSRAATDSDSLTRTTGCGCSTGGWPTIWT